MADSLQEQPAQDDVDHGLGDVDALVIVAYQATRRRQQVSQRSSWPHFIPASRPARRP